MSMTEWAKREVEIAVTRERESEGCKEGEFSYGGACYESALKAFESLCEDGHSGMSIGFTKHILNRLIDGKPLTPIQDTDDEWNRISHTHRKSVHYQCKRMSSLFKDIYSDGSVHYSDIGRYYCKDINNGSTFTNGLVASVLDEMFPITMPYFPENKPYVFTVESLKLQDTSGDYDTIVIHFVEIPDGITIGIHRYFTEDETGETVEIMENEYIDLRVKADIRKINESMKEYGENEE